MGNCQKMFFLQTMLTHPSTSSCLQESIMLEKSSKFAFLSCSWIVTINIWRSSSSSWEALKHAVINNHQLLWTILRGGGCYSTNFYTRSFCPEVQPLTLLNTTFGGPFLTPSIDNWYPNWKFASLLTTVNALSSKYKKITKPECFLNFFLVK